MSKGGVVGSRILGCLLVVFWSATAGAEECIPDNVDLHSQAEVDSFQVDNGPCEVVRGTLTVSGEDIVDLTPLAGLVKIHGDLVISRNPALESLAGLMNVRAASSLRIGHNDRLRNLHGLSALETLLVGLEVGPNASLVTLDGMPSLETLGFYLEVGYNPRLESLHGLNQVRFGYTSQIYIEGNSSLKDLTGVPFLQEVSRLVINGNETLGSLKGLQPGNSTVATGISIQNNPALRNMEGLGWLLRAHQITVYGNHLLEDFTGLSKLEWVEYLSITENDSLVSLHGLETLKSIADLPYGLTADYPFVGYLWIQFNPSLQNLDGLSGLVAADRLNLIDNPQLSDCSGLTPLLDVIDHDQPGPGPGPDQIPDISTYVNLSGNAAGCNSIAEIAPQPDVIKLLTGSWYSPASSGEGFMIHSVQEHIAPIVGVRPGQQGLAVGYFYGFDLDGDRFWLIGVHEGPMNWGEAIEFTATEVAGGRFEGFDAAAIERTDWGTFSFTPENCVIGTLSMKGEFAARPGLQEKELDVYRLANVSGDYCSDQIYSGATDSITGSWYDPVTSGQGFSIHKISDELGIVYFYGFDSNQAPLWLIGVWSSPLILGETIEIEMTEVSGGTFTVVNPADVIRESWGTLSLRMDECHRAYAELDGLDGKQIFFLDQLAESFSLECEH